jgi:hypothetical protein
VGRASRVAERSPARSEVTDLFVTRLKPVCYAFETNEIEVEKGSEKLSRPNNEIEVEKGSEKNCPGPCWRGDGLFGPLVWSIPGSMVRRKFQSNRRR